MRTYYGKVHVLQDEESLRFPKRRTQLGKRVNFPAVPVIRDCSRH